MDGTTRLRAAVADRKVDAVPKVSHSRTRSHVPMMDDLETCWGCGNGTMWIDCPVRWPNGRS